TANRRDCQCGGQGDGTCVWPCGRLGCRARASRTSASRARGPSRFALTRAAGRTDTGSTRAPGPVRTAHGVDRINRTTRPANGLNASMSTFPVIRAVIVDESPQLRRDARQSIARTGLAGIWDFDRGEEALSILPAVVPAVVIVGRQLEDMTGFEFSRRIRSRKGLSGLPLILLSAEGDLEDLMEAVEN